MSKNKRYKRLAKRAVGHCINTEGKCRRCPLDMEKCLHLIGFASAYYINIRVFENKLKGVTNYD